MCCPPLHSPNVTIQVNPRPAEGFEYDRLTEAVRGFEKEGARANNETAAFQPFDNAMEFVDKEGQGVEWAWVRTHNVDAFRRVMQQSSHS